MATEHVTVRLPADLVTDLWDQAKRNGRSLSFVMAARMGYWAQIESALRQESVERRPEGAAPRRVAVTDVVDDPAPARSSGCQSCGGLNGMHQRGCGQRR